MVAYSFKKQFVVPIKAHVKRQTIRATGLRRHARPGDELQLYTAMRTKQCELIMLARCVDAAPIVIRFGEQIDVVEVRKEKPISDIHGLDAFAMADGFRSWDELMKFWDAEHDFIVTQRLTFEGVLIRWEPIS